MGISFSMQTGLFEIGRYHKAPIHLHPAFFHHHRRSRMAIPAHV